MATVLFGLFCGIGCLGRNGYAQESVTAREMGQSVGGIMPMALSASPANGSDRSREMGVWSDDVRQKELSSYEWNDQQVGYLVAQRKLHLSGRISAGWQYDDNIYISDVDAQESGSIALQPSLSLIYEPNSWGLSAAVNYNLDYQWYLDDVRDEAGNAEDHSLNQTVGLAFTWTGAKLRATLGASYSDVDGGDIDVGSRVQGNTMTGHLSLAYDLTGKTTLGAYLSTEILDYSGEYFSSNSYNSSLYVDYRMTAKVSAGLQVGYGVTEVIDGSDSSDYNLSLRANWAATDKWGVHGSAGVENRSYSDGGGDVHPIFDLGINGDLISTSSGKTSFGLTTYSGFHPSASLQDQGYYSIGVVANLTHRWRERWSETIAFGYERAKYVSAADLVEADRMDNYYYIRPNITYAVTDRFSLSLFYQYSINDSDGLDGKSYTRNHGGIMANFAF